MFSKFARKTAEILGHSTTFVLALVAVLIWLLSGAFFDYSDTWQLVINTTTTIITFLMVFLLQNTQNHDTLAIHLKLDELIRAMSNTHNKLLKVEELSDLELQKLLENYESLAEEVRKHISLGEGDVGVIDVK